MTWQLLPNCDASSWPQRSSNASQPWMAAGLPWQRRALRLAEGGTYGKIAKSGIKDDISQLWWGSTWVGTKWLQASNILQRVNAFWVDVTWSERCASWIALPLLNGKACFCQGRKLLLGKSVWSTWCTAAPQPQQVSLLRFFEEVKVKAEVLTRPTF